MGYVVTAHAQMLAACVEPTTPGSFVAAAQAFDSPGPILERHIIGFKRSSRYGHLMDALGAYTADRAAALSGVPRSTIHWWARERILSPSISPTKQRLWSFADLMGLRTIYWLRQRKTTESGVDIPATSMGAVRVALASLSELNVPLWHGDRPTVLANGYGHVYLETPGGVQTVEGQIASGELLDLIAPFSTTEGARGPDLHHPRAQLRIIPGKLSGSPHIVGTRVETRAIAGIEILRPPEGRRLPPLVRRGVATTGCDSVPMAVASFDHLAPERTCRAEA